MYIHESTHKLYHLCVTTEKFCCNLFIEFYVYEYGIVLKLISFYKNSLYGLICFKCHGLVILKPCIVTFIVEGPFWISAQGAKIFPKV